MVIGFTRQRTNRYVVSPKSFRARFEGTPPIGAGIPLPGGARSPMQSLPSLTRNIATTGVTE